MMFCMVYSTLVFAQDSSITLTEEEAAWISLNPVISATFKTDVPPLEFMVNNTPSGFSVDYVNLIAEKIGIKVEYIQDKSWTEQLEMVRRGEIDIVHNAIYTEDRAEYLQYSSPYLDLPMYYYGQFGAQTIENISDVMDKKVGGVTGWASTLQFKKEYPDLDFNEYPTMHAGLEAVAKGEVEVLAGVFPITDYILSQNTELNVERISNNSLEEMSNMNVIRMATTHDNPILNSLIQKALDAITTEEYQEISEKWYDRFNIQRPLLLTPEEINWIEENRIVKVGANVDVPPIEYLNERGEIDGIAGMFLREIEKLTTLRFVPAGNSDWNEALEMLESGDADMSSAIAPTEERGEYLDFSNNYLSVNTMIFALEGGETYRNLRSMSGKTLAMERGGIVDEIVSRDYPEINRYLADSPLDAIEAVLDGRADAVANGMTSTNYYMNQNNIDNLVLVGETEIVVNLSMGVVKDKAILSSIISKALDSIGEFEKAEMTSRWLASLPQKTDYGVVVQFAVIAFAVFGGILVWVYILYSEVKRRRQVEVALIASQRETQKALAEAEEANAAKSNFLANMSHEIRTPLNAIIGFSDVMSSGLYGEIPQQKYKEYLNDIASSGQHLERVINDILDLSKIEAGKWDPEDEELDILDCLMTSVRLIESDATKKDISIVVKNNLKANDGLKNFIGDQIAIRRVFLNLLSNAVKFSPMVSEIKCIIEDAENDQMKITISDQGMGIPKDKIEQVLSPFGQVHEVREFNRSGTGLGLPIVKELVELHGGSFKLESTVGVGTDAIILLPKQKSSE